MEIKVHYRFNHKDLNVSNNICVPVFPFQVTRTGVVMMDRRSRLLVTNSEKLPTLY